MALPRKGGRTHKGCLMTVHGNSGGGHQKFLDSLAAFTKEHQARYWEGTFGTFLEEIVSQRAAAVSRTSHQYLWDMLRWRQIGRASCRERVEGVGVAREADRT